MNIPWDKKKSKNTTATRERYVKMSKKKNETNKTHTTRMWADAQRDGRPDDYRWRPLFNATKFGWCPLLECRACSNAAKTRNPLKFERVPQTRQQISAASGPKFTTL